MREVDASEHTLALLEIIKERRQKENKIEKVFFNLPFVVNVNYNYFQKKLFQQKLIRRMAMEMKKKKMSENATRDDLTEKEDQAQ